MLTEDGPKLLEYNVRFGDPETQAILVRLRTELMSVFEAIQNMTLGKLKLEWAPGASACVIAANGGYPGKYQHGAVIQGLEKAKSDFVQVFHAGTSFNSEGEFIASGGRVLGITSAADDLSQALSQCYGVLEKIHWPGMQYRNDIGRSKPASGHIG